MRRGLPDGESTGPTRTVLRIHASTSPPRGSAAQTSSARSHNCSTRPWRTRSRQTARRSERPTGPFCWEAKSHRPKWLEGRVQASIAFVAHAIAANPPPLQATTWPQRGQVSDDHANGADGRGPASAPSCGQRCRSGRQRIRLRFRALSRPSASLPPMRHLIAISPEGVVSCSTVRSISLPQQYMNPA